MCSPKHCNTFHPASLYILQSRWANKFHITDYVFTNVELYLVYTGTTVIALPLKGMWFEVESISGYLSPIHNLIMILSSFITSQFVIILAPVRAAASVAAAIKARSQAIISRY
jgi:hypothetical protein